MGIQLVWFKRDLRIHDHRPLAEAAKAGPCILLYVYEPELFSGPEFDTSHLEFTNACLRKLRDALKGLGSTLSVRTGAFPEVFDEIHAQTPFEKIWSHEETGNWKTYQRDRRVQRWARENGVTWQEYPQTGVVRRLQDRDGWSREWNARMKQPILPPPESIGQVRKVAAGRIRSAIALGLPENSKTGLQRGGESKALETLDSFLEYRGVNYRADMSSPVTAWDGCSRLSPYLAYGAISMKTVHQRLEERRNVLGELKKSNPDTVDKRWLASLSSFAGRLRWHCHFMQKLEDEPRIEFENMARCFDGVREDDWSQERFEAWCAGQTGYPMVDACMRALNSSSWINFRMRAMIMSFSSYDLWLHWREPAVHLAKHFLDYEPGIHFSQAQMQSGTTGINTMRIYSPAKQVKDQDPTGKFIRKWVPELEGVPDEHLPEPQKMPVSTQKIAGCRIGKHYPAPIVDHLDAVKEARRRMGLVKRSEEARAEAKQILGKHGSRRRPTKQRTKKA